MGTRGQTSTDLGETLPAEIARKAFPAFIRLNRSLSDNELKASAAHEFTHVSQWAYPVAALGLSDYCWLKEATAQWAIDGVYPNNQVEQRELVDYMGSPDLSLETQERGANRVYGSYLFFQFLARTIQSSVIGSIWNATVANADPVQAVDQGIPGGFKKQWPIFAKLLWNQDPVNVNSFNAWDGITDIPALHENNTITGITMNGGKGAVATLDGNIKHLAIHYYQYRIVDPNVRSLTFFNHIGAFGMLGEVDVTVQAFLKRPGSAVWEYEHWSDEGIDKEGVKSYCLDVTAERLEQFVVVMSNNHPTLDIFGLPSQLAPRVSVSNVGCWRYEGSASVVISGTTPVQPTFRSQADGSALFERYRPAQMPNGAPGQETFQVISGAITASLNQTDVATCTLFQQASDNISPGLDSGTLTVNLGVDIATGLPSRNVSGSGTATAFTHITLTCPGQDPIETTGQNAWNWFDLPTPTEPNGKQVEVLPDGTIQGSFTRALAAPASGTALLTWHFTPQRQ